VSTIQETVQDALASSGYGQYASYAQPVVTALVNREQEIVGQLIQFAERADLDVEAVRSTFADAGLHMPTPPTQNIAAAPPPRPAPAGFAEDTAATPDAAPDLAATLARIEQTLTGLTSFARENGYRG
jgi:hypothetical protein